MPKLSNLVRLTIPDEIQYVELEMGGRIIRLERDVYYDECRFSYMDSLTVNSEGSEKGYLSTLCYDKHAKLAGWYKPPPYTDRGCRPNLPAGDKTPIDPA